MGKFLKRRARWDGFVDGCWQPDYHKYHQASCVWTICCPRNFGLVPVWMLVLQNDWCALALPGVMKSLCFRCACQVDVLVWAFFASKSLMFLKEVQKNMSGPSRRAYTILCANMLNYDMVGLFLDQWSFAFAHSPGGAGSQCWRCWNQAQLVHCLGKNVLKFQSSSFSPHRFYLWFYYVLSAKLRVCFLLSSPFARFGYPIFYSRAILHKTCAHHLLLCGYHPWILEQNHTCSVSCFMLFPICHRESRVQPYWSGSPMFNPSAIMVGFPTGSRVNLPILIYFVTSKGWSRPGWATKCSSSPFWDCLSAFGPSLDLVDAMAPKTVFCKSFLKNNVGKEAIKTQIKTGDEPI